MEYEARPVKSALKITEEVFNSATHGFGALAAITGLILGLLSLSAPTHFVVGFILYSASLIVLMVLSSLYHAFTFSRAKNVFQILDHCAIYVLIAGTYTPFALALYAGRAQIFLLALVWSLAALCIVLESAWPKIIARFGASIYITFGWLGLVLVPKLIHSPVQIIWLLVAGGIIYTCGVLITLIKKPFIHTVWHMFVVAAACMQFFAILKLA